MFVIEPVFGRLWILEYRLQGFMALTLQQSSHISLSTGPS